jgi:hypothetical protein
VVERDSRRQERRGHQRVSHVVRQDERSAARQQGRRAACFQNWSTVKTYDGSPSQYARMFLRETCWREQLSARTKAFIGANKSVETLNDSRDSLRARRDEGHHGANKSWREQRREQIQRNIQCF